jgi:hypothetical protein
LGFVGPLGARWASEDMLFQPGQFSFVLDQAYMTPEWKEAFKYATTLADRLGLEEAIAGSPGWSETGGPWVPPSQGMKKYVWSETSVEGGYCRRYAAQCTFAKGATSARFSEKLPMISKIRQ